MILRVWTVSCFLTLWLCDKLQLLFVMLKVKPWQLWFRVWNKLHTQASVFHWIETRTSGYYCNQLRRVHVHLQSNSGDKAWSGGCQGCWCLYDSSQDSSLSQWPAAKVYTSNRRLIWVIGISFLLVDLHQSALLNSHFILTYNIFGLKYCSMHLSNMKFKCKFQYVTGRISTSILSEKNAGE